MGYSCAMRFPHDERVLDLIDRTGKFARTDMHYLVRGGFWLTLGQIVSVAAGFVLSYVLGNFVSKEVFGTYKFVFSLAGMFGTASLTAIGTTVAQAVARGHEGALRQGFRSYLIWSIPSVIAAFAGSAYYFYNENTTLASSLLIVAICSPLLTAFNLYASFLQGKKEFRRSSVYGFFLSVIPPLFLISLVITGYTDSVFLLIAAYYISIVALSAFFHIRTMRIYRPRNERDPAMMRNAVHLSFINVLGRVASYADSVLVFHYLGAAPLAVYAFAFAPPQYVLRFNGIFKSLALPKLAERDIPTLKRTLPRKIMLHFFVAGIATVGYILLCPYFYQYLFPQYIDSIPYSQALGLIILTAPGVWLGQTLIAHMRKKELYLLNTVSPLIKLALFVTLIPLFGIWGVVYAALATGVLGFMLSAWVFSRL